MEVADLLEQVDIVEYIGQFVSLTEKNGEFWGLSPFKSENTPSFSVRRESNRFYDFSSGIGGSPITFAKYYYNISSAEAVNKLKEYIGEDGNVVTHKKFSATRTAKLFSPQRKNQKVSKSANIPDNYSSRYEYRPDKMSVWADEGISIESMDKFQVRYDSFSNRLVYPIHSVDGKIVNIGGRTLDEQWKEKGLRKYTYFYKWGTLDTIYGIAENMQSIRESREIILFEGCKSVLLADTWGIHNAGALLTSHLNPQQMKILARLGCRVVFALDKDVDIKKDHNINKLKQFVNVEYIYDAENLLGAKDAPVDKGLDVWNKLYERRMRYR